MKQFKLKKERYNNTNIYVYDLKNMTLMKKVINKEYEIEKEFKNDSRTYVAKILIDKKEYILKKPYNNKIMKKILTIFKSCESLTVLKNVGFFRQKGLNELVDIIGAGICKKGIIIEKEFYLMEFLNGKIFLKDSKYQQILEVVKKIHKLGRYHGDCNPYNFLFNDNGIHIIDTKLKKMLFGNYRAHYDILTLIKYFKTKVEYPYKKNMFYYIAYLMRKIRG